MEPAGETGVHVSITGLTLHSWIHTPRFLWFAQFALRQARTADGNISADVRTVDGVHHTLTIWRDRKAMLVFMRSDAHAKAMRALPSLGMGRTLGYAADHAPDWDTALARWQAEAVAY